MKKTKYFSQFSWAIPLGFADALSQCQFGEGDILYPKKAAYDELWDVQKIGYAIQILYPARQTNVPKEDVSEVFKKNWASEVRLQKYYCKSPEDDQFTKKGELISTTQGRLYTSIWTGDLKFLESDSADPIMPLVHTREAVKLIKTDSNVTTNRIEQVEKTALEKSKGAVVFAMPYDRSNKVSQAKFLNIQDTLKLDLTGKPILLTPRQAEISDWRLFQPTVNIALFVTPKLNAKSLHEKVKKATYVKAKDRKTDRDAYDIKKHGHIFS